MEKTLNDLLLSYQQNFPQLLKIIEALAHEKRLQILMSLLTGNKSFSDLKKSTQLEKTALASHLKKLLQVRLINKPAYNTYAITDGKLF